MVLAEQPLCPRCKDAGYIVPAVDVDHDDNDPTNNERANLIGLCHACHSAKTRATMHRRFLPLPPPKGCDANGIPLDPAHPWRQSVARLLEKSPATEAGEPTGSTHAQRRETGV